MEVVSSSPNTTSPSGIVCDAVPSSSTSHILSKDQGSEHEHSKKDQEVALSTNKGSKEGSPSPSINDSRFVIATKSDLFQVSQQARSPKEEMELVSSDASIVSAITTTSATGTNETGDDDDCIAKEDIATACDCEYILSDKAAAISIKRSFEALYKMMDTSTDGTGGCAKKKMRTA